uniref:Zinc finger, CCHC-type, retrotransposon Gag domain protein n=1 Tax=Tanacetum cinerariifolium TaxID=118510 RepID=A0A6L2K643_TANCI|nr:zinc finger, CCHC-type, retrotransposon Gag domain protein [Tanacetum cinerariifolium]
MDDLEDASKHGGIAELDADEDFTLEEVDVKVTIDANVQGRLEESQAKVYHLDLEHAKKVVTMQDTDEAEPAEVEEVIELVTAAKLMTEVVTTITAALVPKASAPRRRRGVIIQDPKEATTASVIVQLEVKSKDKGKGILVKEPKPLKRQAQIEQYKAFARELEAELNANINWNDVVDQVKRKERQDNTAMIYQALKRKPVTKAQARKNMMVYLKNMAGFKMDFFRGMTSTDIRPIFEKHYNLNQAFLERVEKEVTENWISHIKKIFEVLGCDDQFKAKLVTYKLEGDAHSWWRAYKQAKGAQAANDAKILKSFVIGQRIKETTRGTDTAIVYDHQKHHHRGLIRELMIEGIVTNMETMVDMATGKDMALTDGMVIDRAVTNMVMVVTDREIVVKRRSVTKINRYGANIIVVLMGHQAKADTQIITHVLHVTFMGNFIQERRVTGTTGACFECG